MGADTRYYSIRTGLRADMKVEGSAPGKLILFGEHAVVHGAPALAVPLAALRTTVTVEESPPGSGLSILLPENNQVLRVHLADDSSDNTLSYTAELVLRELKWSREPDLKLLVTSTIPVGAGLGSGAAVSAAIARALSAALGHPLDNESLNELVFAVEKIHHGNPSGIDNTVIVYEKPLFFIKGQPIETLMVKQPFRLLVADSGHRTPTYVTVGEVGRLFGDNPSHFGEIFSQIGKVVQQARTAIENGDLEQLGALMNENHTLLRELTVSDEKLDAICRAAREAGAWGAKLSGGGRGGMVIALVVDAYGEDIREAMLSAGALGVINTVVGN